MVELDVADAVQVQVERVQRRLIASVDARRASILAVGTMPEWLTKDFEDDVVHVTAIDAAWAAVTSRDFRTIVVAPHVEGESDGLRFALSVKEGATSRDGPPEVDPAYRRKAFLLLPVPGDDQYAVWRSQTRWVLAEGNDAAIRAELELLLRES